MDDYTEIIIYVILGLAALVGNLYRNYSKKKQDERRMARQQHETQSGYEPARPKQSPVFPDFETLLGIPKEEPKIDPWSDFEEDEYTKTKEVEPEIKESERIHSEGEAVFAETEEELITDDLLAEDNFSISDYVKQQESELYAEPEKEAAIDFDPLKAVIYSEILKRPEY